MSLVGSRIRERRKALGMNAESLAESVDLSPATIYRYENGDIGRISSATLISLANILRTTVDYLLGETDDPEMQLYTDREWAMLGEVSAIQAFDFMARYAGYTVKRRDGEIIGLERKRMSISISESEIPAIMEKPRAEFNRALIELGD